MAILNAIMDDDKYQIAELFGNLFNNAQIPGVRAMQVKKKKQKEKEKN